MSTCLRSLSAFVMLSGLLFRCPERGPLSKHSTSDTAPNPVLIRTIEVSNAGRRVAISRDGKLVAAVVIIREGDNVYHRIRLYRIKDGNLVRELSEPVGLISPMQFSPDGRYLVAGSVKGSDRAIEMWRVADGHQVFRIPAIVVPDFQFSADGKLLSAVDWREVKLYEIPSGKLIRTFSGATENVWAVAISPDNRYIAGGGYDWSFRIWRIEDGTLVRTLVTGFGPVENLTFSPDSDSLAVGCGYDPRGVQLWRVANGKKVRTFNDARSAQFCNDGSVFAGDTAVGVRIWDTNDAGNVRTVAADVHDRTRLTLTDQGDLMWGYVTENGISIWKMHVDKGNP